MMAPGNVIHGLKPLDWLLQRGHEVIFIDGENPYPDGKENFLFIPWLHSGDDFAIPLLKGVWDDLLPDLVHVHWADYRAYQCMKAGLSPLVITVWGSDINNYFISGPVSRFLLDRDLLGETLRKADTVFLDTPDIEQKCLLLAGGRITAELLTLGVNTSLFKPGYKKEVAVLREHMGIESDDRIFLSIRAMRPIYNHQQILLAFSQAVGRFSRKTLLVFRKYNNRDFSDYETSLMTEIEKLDLSGHVRWMEPCRFSEMPVVYALADCVINFPLNDAFPVTFLEAAACMRPVISNRLPAYEHTLAERYFDMTVSPDPSELAEAMVCFVNTGDSAPASLLRSEKLIRARRETEIHFDESLTQARLLEIYRQLISLYREKGNDEQKREKRDRKPLNLARRDELLGRGLENLDLANLKTPQDYYQIGSVFKSLGRDDRAVECFREVLRKTSRDKYFVGACYHLGDIYFRQGALEESKALLERCLSLNCEHGAAKTLYAVLKQCLDEKN